MAKMTITPDRNGIPTYCGEYASAQTIDGTIAHAETDIIDANDDTEVLIIPVNNDCYVKVGANPVALTDGTCSFIPAQQPRSLNVPAGHRISVVGANLNITIWG
jgi:hypothetical protein